ncbi:MAG: aldehyde dehydrogenase family protein, partial [Chloroflexota bacterium]
WDHSTAHARAQILYFIAENLSIRQSEFAHRLIDAAGSAPATAAREVDEAIQCLFRYAAWADKFDGLVHRTPFRGVTLASPEPIGVMGIACPDESPLLALVSLVAPAIAMGNTVVVVPSQIQPLSATDLYQVLETSDVPGGVINIVTGQRNLLATVLAEHDDVDGIWYFGDAEGVRAVEYASAGNMKRSWAHQQAKDWLGGWGDHGDEFLREATNVKNVWVPYGA